MGDEQREPAGRTSSGPLDQWPWAQPLLQRREGCRKKWAAQGGVFSSFSVLPTFRLSIYKGTSDRGTVKPVTPCWICQDGAESQASLGHHQRGGTSEGRKCQHGSALNAGSSLHRGPVCNTKISITGHPKSLGTEKSLPQESVISKVPLRVTARFVFLKSQMLSLHCAVRETTWWIHLNFMWIFTFYLQWLIYLSVTDQSVWPEGQFGTQHCWREGLSAL